MTILTNVALLASFALPFASASCAPPFLSSESSCETRSLAMTGWALVLDADPTLVGEAPRLTSSAREANDVRGALAAVGNAARIEFVLIALALGGAVLLAIGSDLDRLVAMQMGLSTLAALGVFLIWFAGIDVFGPDVHHQWGLIVTTVVAWVGPIAATSMLLFRGASL